MKIRTLPCHLYSNLCNIEFLERTNYFNLVGKEEEIFLGDHKQRG